MDFVIRISSFLSCFSSFVSRNGTGTEIFGTPLKANLERSQTSRSPKHANFSDYSCS